MVSRLLEEVKQVFAWNELQKKKKKCTSLERTMQRHDVGMRTQGLMQCSLYAMVLLKLSARLRNGIKTYLEELAFQRLWIEIRFTEHLDGILPAIDPLFPLSNDIAVSIV